MLVNILQTGAAILLFMGIIAAIPLVGLFFTFVFIVAAIYCVIQQYNEYTKEEQ